MLTNTCGIQLTKHFIPTAESEAQNTRVKADFIVTQLIEQNFTWGFLTGKADLEITAGKKCASYENITQQI